jgi:hypothetical protein
MQDLKKYNKYKYKYCELKKKIKGGSQNGQSNLGYTPPVFGQSRFGSSNSASSGSSSVVPTGFSPFGFSSVVPTGSSPFGFSSAAPAGSSSGAPTGFLDSAFTTLRTPPREDARSTVDATEEINKVMNNLRKTYNFNDFKRFVTNPASSFECPVTLDRICRPSITPCGHLFDKDSLRSVITKAKQHREDPKCPMCRNTFSPEYLNLSEGIKKWYDRESKQ